MIYTDALGRPTPEATILKFVGSPVYHGEVSGYLAMTTTSNAPCRRWEYKSKDVSEIVREMEADGWECTVSTDGYGHPRIHCVHLETKAAQDAARFVPQGEGVEGFIRFGDLPESGHSVNHATGEREPGVSVYRATFYVNGYIVDTPHYSQGTYIAVRTRKPYRVYGEVVGTGSDGELCIKVTRTEEI